MLSHGLPKHEILVAQRFTAAMSAYCWNWLQPQGNSKQRLKAWIKTQYLSQC